MTVAAHRITLADLFSRLGDDLTISLLERFGGCRLPESNIARRDVAIRAALDAGRSYEAVAVEYCLSVRQIIRIGKYRHREAA